MHVSKLRCRGLSEPPDGIEMDREKEKMRGGKGSENCKERLIGSTKEERDKEKLLERSK